MVVPCKQISSPLRIGYFCEIGLEFDWAYLGTPMDSGIYITEHFETTSFLSNRSTKNQQKKKVTLLVPFTTTQKRPTFLPPSTAENHTGIEKNGYNV